MSAPQHKRRVEAAPPEATIRDVDLLTLFPPSTAANKNAILLVQQVKILAAGRRFVNVYDQTLWNALGWSETTLRRAKKRCREAGLIVSQKRASHGGLVASQWVLDRRWIKPLRAVQDGQGLVSISTPDIGSLKGLDPRPSGVGSGIEPCSDERAPPTEPAPVAPALELEDESVTRADAPPPPGPAPPEPVVGEPPLTRLLDQLRSQLPRKGRDDESAARAVVAYAAALAPAPFMAELALQRLADELRGEHRLRLAQGIDPRITRKREALNRDNADAAISPSPEDDPER